MTVISFISETPGFSGTRPRIAQMVCTDNLSTITTPGFLNNIPLCQGQPKSNGDFVLVIYGVTVQGGGIISGGTPALLTMSIPNNSSIITLQVPTTDVPAFVQGVTAGTSADNKALSLDSLGRVDLTYWTDILGNTEYYNKYAVKTVNILSTTPGTGTCVVRTQFLNAGGAAVSQGTPIFFYVSDPAGNISTAVTSIAANTNGTVTTLVTGQVCLGACDSSGLLGLTLTASAGSYYLTFISPNGQTSPTPTLIVH